MTACMDAAINAEASSLCAGEGEGATLRMGELKKTFRRSKMPPTRMAKSAMPVPVRTPHGISTLLVCNNTALPHEPIRLHIEPVAEENNEQCHDAEKCSKRQLI